MSWAAPCGWAAWACRLAEGSFAHKAYGTREIQERHRHRYEFNREYEDRLKAAGLKITGETPDNTYVEICEIADHPGIWAASSIPSSRASRWSPIPLFKILHRSLRGSPGKRLAEIEEPLFSRAT